MWPIVTDQVLWVCQSVCPSSTVCWFVTVVTPANTAQLIEMLFGLRTRVGPRNHVLDRVLDPPWKGAILRREGRPIVKYRDTVRSAVQKRLNQLICHLGCGFGWAQGIMYYMALQIPSRELAIFGGKGHPL